MLPAAAASTGIACWQVWTGLCVAPKSVVSPSAQRHQGIGQAHYYAKIRPREQIQITTRKLELGK